MPDVDVLVIGAGLAGLTAARDAERGGATVAVLEARDRVGGRLVNQEIGDGKVVEAGGQWIGPTQDRVAALARELGLETFPTHTQGDSIFEWRGRVRRYRGTIPRINAAVLADYGQAQLRLDRMARQVSTQAPWSAARAARWDGRTLQSWLDRNMATPGGRELLRVITEAVWAAEPEDVSLLHFLFYVHSAGGIDALVDTEGGAQQDRVVGGSQRLAIELAKGLDVRLETPVHRIEHSTTEVRAGGLTASRAIVAVPPTMALRIAFDPPLPSRRDQLLQRMPAGAVIKCHAVYDEPFWRADGLSGDGGSDAGPAKIVYDNSPPDGSPGVLLAFYEGDQARRFSQRPQQERREAMLAQLGRLFGLKATRPTAYYDRDWTAEEWTRGCYGAFLPPGTWTAVGDAMRPPVGRLHWAGAELAERWSGYMDGAVRSGEAAAAAVLAAA